MPELLLQHLHIVALQLHDRGVAQHVHVGGRRIDHDLLRHHTQHLARCRDIAFRRLHLIGRAEAVEQRLRCRHPHAAPSEPVALARVNVAKLAVGVLGPCTRGDGDFGLIARQRDVDLLAGLAHESALRVQLRIVLIGLGENPGESFRARAGPKDRQCHHRKGNNPQHDIVAAHRCHVSAGRPRQHRQHATTASIVPSLAHMMAAIPPIVAQRLGPRPNHPRHAVGK